MNHAVLQHRQHPPFSAQGCSDIADPFGRRNSPVLLRFDHGGASHRDDPWKGGIWVRDSTRSHVYTMKKASHEGGSSCFQDTKKASRAGGSHGQMRLGGMRGR